MTSPRAPPGKGRGRVGFGMVGIILITALAGCFAPDEYVERDVALEFVRGSVAQALCDASSRANSSCHILTIKVKNERAADTTSIRIDRWTAVVARSDEWRSPRAVQGGPEGAGGSQVEVQLRFAFGYTERIEVVNYRADWESAPGPLLVPRY